MKGCQRLLERSDGRIDPVQDRDCRQTLRALDLSEQVPRQPNHKTCHLGGQRGAQWVQVLWFQSWLGVAVGCSVA